MLVIPAVDIQDGRCVRLRQGRKEDVTVFSDDPAAAAKGWAAAGARRLHLVDLDGAFAGKPVNGESIRAIVQACPDVPVQVGGGLRDGDAVESLLGAGVAYAILGTRAVQDPDFAAELCKRFPKRIIISLDARNGRVALAGWAEQSAQEAVSLARRFAAAGVAALVYTDIERDGMMQGINRDATERVVRAVPVPVFASGGLRDLEDLAALKRIASGRLGGVIAGRALYEGQLDLSAAQQLCDSPD